METTQCPRLRLQLETIPDYIREDVGRTLYQSFMERIRDPEVKRQYDELGRAFLERYAAKKGGEG